MPRALKLVLLAIAIIIAVLVAFEAYAVWRASARTPAIISAQRNRPVTLAQIGERRLSILLKVEDPSFFGHRGVDFATPGQGRTTLTQALVKRLYFDGGFKPGFAKIEQSLIARFVLRLILRQKSQQEFASETSLLKDY